MGCWFLWLFKPCINFQISKLLVVDDSKRLTIAGALNHEVFRAQRFSRSVGTANAPNDESSPSLEGTNIALSNSEVCDNRLSGRESITSMPTAPPIIVLDDGDKSSSVQLFSPVFNARQTFKISIMCVRFLIRLLYIKKTPELLCLKKTQVNPYCMRSYRKTIDQCAFTIYR